MRSVAETSPQGACRPAQGLARGLQWLLDECSRRATPAKLKLPGLAAGPPGDSCRAARDPGGAVSTCSASRRCGSPTAHSAKGCSTTCSAPHRTRTRARAACAPWRRAFHVDAVQAERVESTALAFLRQVRAGWKLDEPLAELALRWAARLHESGSTSPTHSTTSTVRTCCSTPTCRASRARSSRCSRPWSAITGARSNFAQVEDLVPPWHLKAEFLIVLLRLAVLLHRGRGPRAKEKKEKENIKITEKQLEK